MEVFVTEKWITDLRESFINDYVDPHQLRKYKLQSACHEEHADMVSYNGRQILELLQNVDDACDPDNKNAFVKISFKENLLEVGNTGTSFCAETIERLCEGGASDKSGEKIGNKGTGFRSLLNDAEWIELHSGDFSIKFSKEYANELFKHYSDRQIINDQLKSWRKDYPLCFPIMHCPQAIDKYNSDFSTLIRVKIKKNESIKAQLRQPFYRALLFLPHITKITIETDEGEQSFEKEAKAGSVSIRRTHSYENSNLVEKPETEEYFFFEKVIDIKNKKTTLIVAVPKNKNYPLEKETLYCYFPIRDYPTPIRALVHAPFETNGSRDSLVKESDINKALFEEIITFLKEVAEQLTALEKSDSALQMVIMSEKSQLWNDDSFKKSYMEIIASAKILPTVNNTFISINDVPKILKNDFPEELKGNEFKNLLIASLGSECIDFIQKFTKEIYYTQQELSEKISALSELWSEQIRVKVFLWWSNHCKGAPVFPKLLKDSNGVWIENQKEAIFLPTENFSDLPDKLSWAKIRILPPETTKEIIRQIKENDMETWEKIENNYEDPSDKRVLNIYSKENLPLKFTEQNSASEIINTVNKQINSVEKARSFFTWFFQKYYQEENPPEIKLELPISNTEIKPATELYFGKEYGNPLADKLFNGTSFTPLASLESLFDEEFDGKNKEEVVKFLKKFNVKEYPEIKIKELNDKTEFVIYISKKYSKELKEEKIKNVNYVSSKNIDNFEQLISSLSMEEIKEWLSKDTKLKEALYSEEKTSTVKQQFSRPVFYFSGNEYIKYVLNTTPWIEFEQKKYAPFHIVMYEELKNKIDNIYGISTEKLEDKLGEDISKHFKLGFRKSMADFEDELIRKIIERLPDIDITGKISKKLYRDLIDSKKDSMPSYNTSGFKLLAKDGNFYPNTELKYADKLIFNIDKNKKRYIDISPKQSITTIRNWLGVERYKSNLKLEKHTPCEKTKKFQDEFQDIQIAVLSTIKQNKENIQKIKKISIVPCVEIIVTDTEQVNSTYALDDYFYIENGNDFLFKIPNLILENDDGISFLRRQNKFQSSITDIFKQVLSLELDENLIENLVSKDANSKREKIEEIGSGKWEEAQNFLLNQEKIIEKALNFFRENGLNEPLFINIKKLDFFNLKHNDFKVIIDALKNIKKEIKDLTKFGLDIDLRPYYLEKIKEEIDKMDELYTVLCYEKAKGTENEKDFLKNILKFKNYEVSINDLKNQTTENVTGFLYEKFPLLHPCKFNDIKEKIKEYDIEERIEEIKSQYNNNVQEIENKYFDKADRAKGVNFDDFIQHREDIKSLLYFRIPENIEEKIKDYKQKIKNEDIGNQTYLENLSERTSTVEKTSTVKRILEKDGIYNLKKRHYAGNKSTRSYERENRFKAKAGKNAERIAFEELKKQYPEIIWHSENTERPADRNNPPPGNIVCDMWNKDPKKYFEVKSFEYNEFIMTAHEYESIRNNQVCYEVVLVKDSKISRHTFSDLDGKEEVNEYIFKLKES